VDKRPISTSFKNQERKKRRCSSSSPSKLAENQSVKGANKVSDVQYILSPFILRVALHCTEAELLDELAAQIQDNHFGSANFFGLGPDLVPVFLLTNIGEEAYDLIALFQ
jgi:hypothetical protein